MIGNFPLPVSRITAVSGEANSDSTCRHAPHGEIGFSPLVVIATALSRRLPWVIALTIAERSAQIVRPKEAFSTFTPVAIEPSSNKRAAATWIFE